MFHLVVRSSYVKLGQITQQYVRVSGSGLAKKLEGRLYLRLRAPRFYVTDFYHADSRIYVEYVWEGRDWGGGSVGGCVCAVYMCVLSVRGHACVHVHAHVDVRASEIEADRQTDREREKGGEEHE